MSTFCLNKVLTENDGSYGVRLIVPGIGRRPDYSVSDRLVELRRARHTEELTTGSREK